MSHPTIPVEPLTIEEYSNLPEEHRGDLVHGRLVREPPPGLRHGWVAGRIQWRLVAWAEGGGHGIVTIESGFVLQDDPDPIVRGPDVAFVAVERVRAEDLPVGYGRFAPDLAVEVISPNDRASEVRSKVLDYLAAGTRLVWVVDPETRSVEVHRTGREGRTAVAGEALEDADVLPGFRLTVEELFRPPSTGGSVRVEPT